MPRRSLMLAGGGVKVSFQAGVLQVWLDEAGLEFDHADGVSAACFNLAMWAQGMSGRQIADNWRNVGPIAAVDVNWPQLARFVYAESLFELDGYRKTIFPAWGLDWDKLRASGRDATFNVYNFSKHVLRVVTPAEMTEDLLVATASLPMWFPPVRIGGDTIIDAVFNTGSNLEEAIRRGADELWVIWTVSERGEWADGFVGNFFSVFEAVQVWGYKEMLRRIRANNDEVARGASGEFGRTITVRELKAEVPIHYLLNFSKDRVTEVVNRGVAAARVWCAAQGIPLKGGDDYATDVHTVQTRLQFMEVLRGTLDVAGADVRAEARFTIVVDGVNRFITSSEHAATLDGTLACGALGGTLRLRNGTFNLLVDDGDPTKRRITYRAQLAGAAGDAYTFSAQKDVHDEPGMDAWSDITAAHVTVSRGDDVIGRGVLRNDITDVLKQFTSFRVEGPTLADRSAALARFGALYLGKLWDVYARRFLTYGPL